MIFEALMSSEAHFDLMDLKKKMWTFEDAEFDTSQHIQNDIRFLRNTRILVVVMLLFASLICLPITGDIREFFCILYLVGDIESTPWYPYFQCMVLFLKIFFALSFSNPLFMMMSILGDNAYSIRILRERIRAIEDIFGRKDMWYEDRAYQKYVELTLIRCIQEHRNIKACHKIVSQVVRRNLPAVFFVVVLFFTSFYYNIQMNMSHKVMMKSLVNIATCLVIAYLFINVSQNLIDESNDLYGDLCSCPWFLWNKSNKSCYTMFLVHAKEPLTVSFFGIDYDFTILVRMAKTTMSVLTAIQQLT
ncbi:uncharacterized protein LOC123318447 [Coccinella septempunctata]|uniref:uncharacterized protein LOC123318447 n=1 Tax=Coccinella septempunctata TaxID=41139 RepID=UPI001D06A812|nr:uncharacterized protein LOC123318447 [Coccinella septempunctata]